MSPKTTSPSAADKDRGVREDHPYIAAAEAANNNSLLYWRTEANRLTLLMRDICVELKQTIGLYKELKESYDTLLTDYNNLQLSYNELKLTLGEE